MTVLDAVAPAVVLGRAQQVDEGIAERAAAAGAEVVRRVSGGSAVWVGPGECAWVDLVIGRDHPAWEQDIGRAGCWAGEAWVAAFASVGMDGLVVHRTAMVRSPGSEAVCFAGRGPGEVFTATGEKLVGISQRRTREWAMFQCAVPLRWDPSALIEVLGPSAAPARDAAVRTVDASVTQAAIDALARTLAR